MGRRKNIPPIKKTYAIIVDGETEVWYFNMLKRNERQLRINIKPELPAKKTIAEQYKSVLESAENNTKVFWVVDFDTLLKETKEAKKGATTPLDEFDKYHKKLKKDHFENVVVIINSPCLEFWFLLHFKKSTRFYDQCQKAETQLKKHFKNYEKTKKFFTKEMKDIYLRLKPKLKDALENAKKLKDFKKEKPYTAMAQMHKFYLDKEIEPFLFPKEDPQK